MKLTSHVIVKNEDIWVLYAIKSVLPFSEKILVYDTGSTDRTVEIIKSINSPKIIFEEKGLVDRAGLVKLRQEQIDKTKTGWFLIVDGDEIWPERELKKLTDKADQVSGEVAALVNRTRNSIGDIYHYLPDEAGRYSLAGKTGNLNMRLIRKSQDLKITGEYPLEAYTDKDGSIASRTDKLLFVDCWYLHTTFLKRSSLDRTKTSGSFGKMKMWERGKVMTRSELPEVLFGDGPADTLKRRGVLYEAGALLTAPLIKVKRKFK